MLTTVGEVLLRHQRKRQSGIDKISRKINMVRESMILSQSEIPVFPRTAALAVIITSRQAAIASSSLTFTSLFVMMISPAKRTASKVDRRERSYGPLLTEGVFRQFSLLIRYLNHFRLSENEIPEIPKSHRLFCSSNCEQAFCFSLEAGNFRLILFPLVMVQFAHPFIQFLSGMEDE